MLGDQEGVSTSRSERGQTLVEAVFIITVIGFILSATAAGAVYFVRVARSSRMRVWATQLAREKLEAIRAQAETNPQEFWNNGSFNQEETMTQPAPFERQTTVTIEGVSPNRKAKVTVKLSWQEADQGREIQLQTYLREHY